MFCINHNRFGLAQSHIERYNAGEKQVILTPEQTQELDAKHFSQTQPAETIYVPARGEDTVVQSQAPLFKIEEVETQIEQMYEYTSAGESGFENLHLKYAYKTCDILLIQTNLIVMENRIIDQYKSKKHCSPATIPCSKDVQSAKLKSIKTNLQSHHPECYQPNTGRNTPLKCIL
ncbi:Hypothetical_protein [Hexamita inflata]|uniref:Hypothetical_protein n=1 Tax=Hexamita inflata TaxID=28002 RepID=A0AA86PJQ6_9EUKA|nr:Hypothetical protein HINF_LOCUS24685 [Hexamita inflata]